MAFEHEVRSGSKSEPVFTSHECELGSKRKKQARKAYFIGLCSSFRPAEIEH